MCWCAVKKLLTHSLTHCRVSVPNQAGKAVVGCPLVGPYCRPRCDLQCYDRHQGLGIVLWHKLHKEVFGSRIHTAKNAHGGGTSRPWTLPSFFRATTLWSMVTTRPGLPTWTGFAIISCEQTSRRYLNQSTVVFSEIPTCKQVIHSLH